MGLRIRSAVLVLIAWLGLATAASSLDLHQFWDQRCQNCHGHAGDFARRHLQVENGLLAGQHHRDNLKQFMARHEMGPEHVERIYGMLLAQATTKPVYQQKCAACHGTAAELARISIARKDGVLIALPSERPLADLLKRHGKLTADEIPTVLDSLARVLGEVKPN
jgi:hypothetical protein